MSGLIEQTNAYKAILSEKKAGSLSHAYLIECGDELMLKSYLKKIAKLIMCEEKADGFCGECRVCKLIEKQAHPDVSFYPADGEKLKTAHADEIVAQTIIKPLEATKRLFVIDGFEKFEKAQNKLLKTLEEPPENVVLLLGTARQSSILPTVKSRAKQLEIPPFSNDVLFNYFSSECEDKQKLEMAIALSRGFESGVRENYFRNDFNEIKNLALTLLAELNTSRDALGVASKISGVDFNLFISVLKLVFGELLKAKNGLEVKLVEKNLLSGLIEKYKTGAIIDIIEGFNKIERAQHFNANQTMSIDRLLFLILEAKHRWQKL